MLDEAQKQEILQALPKWIEEDAAFRNTLLRMLRGEFADRQQTESRFEQLLDELRRDREAQTRKWEEQNRKWQEMRAESERKWQESQRKWEEMKAESERKWEESQRKWEEMKAESERKWQESQRKWEEMKAESERKWEENERKWEESQRKWEEMKAESELKWQEMKAESDRRWREHCDEFDKVHQEIMALSERVDRKLTAIGARWGIASERAFHHALCGILEKTFGVQVLNVEEFDEAGEVFGRPEHVELDIVIKNGSLLILELKSSMSKSDVYMFERKARFYEKRHGRKADRLIIVSPMVDERAMKTANALNIEVYSDAVEVP